MILCNIVNSPCSIRLHPSRDVDCSSWEQTGSLLRGSVCTPLREVSAGRCMYRSEQPAVSRSPHGDPTARTRAYLPASTPRCIITPLQLSGIPCTHCLCSRASFFNNLSVWTPACCLLWSLSEWLSSVELKIDLKRLSDYEISEINAHTKLLFLKLNTNFV